MLLLSEFVAAAGERINGRKESRSAAHHAHIDASAVQARSPSAQITASPAATTLKGVTQVGAVERHRAAVQANFKRNVQRGREAGMGTGSQRKGRGLGKQLIKGGQCELIMKNQAGKRTWRPTMENKQWGRVAQRRNRDEGAGDGRGGGVCSSQSGCLLRQSAGVAVGLRGAAGALLPAWLGAHAGAKQERGGQKRRRQKRAAVARVPLSRARLLGAVKLLALG